VAGRKGNVVVHATLKRDVLGVEMSITSAEERKMKENNYMSKVREGKRNDSKLCS